MSNTLISIKVNKESTYTNLIGVYNGTLIRTSWAKFDEKTMRVIDAFNDLQLKVFRLLDERHDLDKLRKIFSIMSALQLCRNRPTVGVSGGVKMKQMEDALLEEFILHVNSLSNLPLNGTESPEKIKDKMNRFFFRSSFVLMFACWYFTLVAALSIIYVILKIIFSVSETSSTVISGVIVGALAGSLVITTHFQKLRNDQQK